ncbi:MAG TPA: PaaI family thioesterase [Nannocystaceae bacterium]|nr:PaaI family thioesterase [Nannocystaceae bacterium]
MTDDARANADRLRVLNAAFTSNVPFNAALGLELVEADSGVATLRLPYREDLVGNPENGVLHGGVVTSVVDAACGAAVFLTLRPLRPIATLDLRIDYLRAAEPGKDLLCRARCSRIATHVAFVQAIAHHGDPAAAVATAAATFMIFAGGQRSSSPEAT